MSLRIGNGTTDYVRVSNGRGALVVRKDHVESGRYKDYKDLKGFKVAVIGHGTSNSSALNEALKRGGHKFEDAESVELAFPQMIAALRNKAIDAAMNTASPTSKAGRRP